MITGEMKNKIDAIWDTFYSSGITTPLTVVEQITYLLFIKLLDDGQLAKEAMANAMGVKVKAPIFKDGNWVDVENNNKEVPYKNMRWHIFKNFDVNTMFDVVRNDVFSFIKQINSGKDSSYSKFMKNAVFMIPTAKTLERIVAGIDSLNMTNKDTMGDVYEYILGQMAASGKNGQFRTPRHIIRMMVNLLKPTLKDNVCDPAMGSAGFLVESAKYVEENYSKEMLKTENLEHYKNNMFYGFDTDPTMLRIGAMNMMLHGVENPNIQYKDSISEDNTDKAKYTMVLANPPFKGSVDATGIDKSLLNITKTTKTELLFLSLFTRILKIGGRCASIVPDGVLFGSSNAHLSIRKELIDNQKLEAVISMPSGVFKPYAGVSTAILIFTKTNAGGTDNVWFYDMKADGFSLDDKRTPISQNDIPDIIERFANLEAEKQRTKQDQSFFVSKEEIVKNNYDLTITKYKEVEHEKVVYDKPEVIMERIVLTQKQIDSALENLKKLLGTTNEE